jgi:hypothetical protein
MMCWRGKGAMNGMGRDNSAATSIKRRDNKVFMGSRFTMEQKDEFGT